jgi:O-antigen chain-terminating methyltransferase
LLILETPNPENLVVGTNNFYLDPSHIRPLPPLLLEFCAEYAGFRRVKTLRLHENPSFHRAEHIHLIDVLSGASPDYAVISQKHANGEVLHRFNAAFQKDFGLSLGELATRHDTFAQRQLDETKIHLEQTQSQIHAELAAKHAELEHQIAQDYALADRLTALLNEEQKLRTQAQAREDELRQQAEQQLQAQQAAAAQLAEHLQAQIAQAQQRYEAHEAQQQSVLAELRQQLEAQRTQAQAREDEIRQQAAQQLQAQQAAAAQQIEHLQAQMNTQIVALLESIQQQTAYAQDLAKHIDTMRSTWWWRISMLWRRPSKWRHTIAPVLTHPFNTPLAVENPNPTAESSGGEMPNAPQPSTNP